MNPLCRKEVGLLMANTLPEGNVPVDTRTENDGKSRSWIIGGTAFMAISGLRLLIGIGSLAAATTGVRFLTSIHGEAIRVPMEIGAVGGSVINLYAIWRVRALRARGSSQWRMGQVSVKTIRAEWVQVAIAILTLGLVAVEWGIHVHLHGSI
jgi:hypothetical protein